MTMRRNDFRANIHRLLGMKRTLAVNVALFAVIAWGFAGEFSRNREIQGEIDRLQSQADQLQTKNGELAALDQRFSSKDVLERAARLQLNLQKPGEQVVVVRGLAKTDAVSAAGLPATQEANPRKWWHYFFP